MFVSHLTKAALVFHVFYRIEGEIIWLSFLLGRADSILRGIVFVV